jgi:hypothetical protein
MSSASYESIPHQVDSLSRDEKLRFIQELATRTVNGSSTLEERSVIELSGLGAGLWNGVDAQEYVNQELASWNG